MHAEVNCRPLATGLTTHGAGSWCAGYVVESHSWPRADVLAMFHFRVLSNSGLRLDALAMRSEITRSKRQVYALSLAVYSLCRRMSFGAVRLCACCAFRSHSMCTRYTLGSHAGPRDSAVGCHSEPRDKAVVVQPAPYPVSGHSQPPADALVMPSAVNRGGDSMPLLCTTKSLGSHFRLRDDELAQAEHNRRPLTIRLQVTLCVVLGHLGPRSYWLGIKGKSDVYSYRIILRPRVTSDSTARV